MKNTFSSVKDLLASKYSTSNKVSNDETRFKKVDKKKQTTIMKLNITEKLKKKYPINMFNIYFIFSKEATRYFNSRSTISKTFKASRS